MAKSSTDTGTSFLELALEIDERVGIEIAKGFQHGCREDTITENIVVGLREILRSRLVYSYCQAYNLECEAYKLSGHPEHHHGDIAFIIRRGDGSRQLPEGVGYMEAKLRNRQSGKFEAFDPVQIDRIQESSPHALILPYDYECPLSDFPDTVLPYESDCEERRVWPTGEPVTAVIPIGLIAKQKYLDRDLYRISLPIGHQIIHRYVRGFDLDYGGSPGGVMERFKRNHPSPWVMMITVSEEENEAMDVSLDVERYRRLEEKVDGEVIKSDLNDEHLRKMRKEEDDREEGLGSVECQ